MQQHVLPGDERVIEHEDRIVLVEPRRQRIVVGRAHDARLHLVGGAAEQLHAGRVHRRDEHDRQIGIVDRHRRVLAEEIVLRQRRRGRDHFRAGDIDAGVGLLLDGDEYVLHLVGGARAIDRRVHDRVVHEQDVFLRAAIPALRVLGKFSVELVVGAERVHQRRLVVGRAPHPAVRHARPGRDGVALADDVLARARDLEEFVGVSARPGVGRPCQHGLALGIVQRVVETRDRARGITERRMRGDVLDPLAVDIDLTPVAQACEILRAGERPPRRSDCVLGLRAAHGFSSTLSQPAKALRGLPVNAAPNWRECRSGTAA